MCEQNLYSASNSVFFDICSRNQRSWICDGCAVFTEQCRCCLIYEELNISHQHLFYSNKSIAVGACGRVDSVLDMQCNYALGDLSWIPTHRSFPIPVASLFPCSFLSSSTVLQKYKSKMLERRNLFDGFQQNSFSRKSF